MPNWKKVIVSGSDAALNSLNVTTALTASGLIYPTTDGLVGQVMTTDGTGNLSFAPVENTAIIIKNVSGATITKGTPCYITGSGTSGNLAGVWPADAANPARMPAGVIAGETLADGAEGVGLINGYIANVDTSAFGAGDSIYVKAGGGYTNVRPTGSAVLVQKLGNVEKSHPSNGSGVINGPAYYNDLPNVATGYTWVGNGNGVAVAIATSSIQNVVSSSFASVVGSIANNVTNNTNNNILTATGAGTINGESNLTFDGTTLTIADGSRPTTIGGSSGTIFTQGEAGGWAFGHHAKGSSGTNRGGFGFYGSSDALTHYYVGQAWNDAAIYVISSSKNVGIGTDSPIRKLHVLGTEWDNTTGGGVIFENSNSVGASVTLKPNSSAVTNGTNGWSLYAGSTGAAIGDGNVGLWAHGTNEARLVVQRGGNVGIGTTSPNNLLNTFIANGAGAFSKGIRIQTGDGSFTTGHGGMLEFQNEDVLTAGIRGVRESGWGSGLVFYVHNTSSGNTFGSTFVERMRINESGRVSMSAYGSGTFTGTAAYRLAVDSSGNIIETALGSSAVDGSGTANYISKWSDSDTLTDSVMYDTGTNVGIGTTSPAYKLSVVGKIALNDGGNSLFIGNNAGLSDDATDNRNIAIGTNASQNNVSGSNNVAIGYNTLVANTNANNTAVGSNALQFSTTSVNNTAFGSFALNANTVGSSSIAVGAAALLSNTIGNHNTAVGNSAIRSNVSGSQNVGVGGSVLFGNTNGSDNVALGWNAARYFGTGTSSLTDTSGSIFIGSLARANASGEVNQIVIGMNALGLGSNSVVLGNDNITKTILKGNVGIGTTNPSSKFHVLGASTDNVGLAYFENNYSAGGIYYPAAQFVNSAGNHSYGIVAGFKIGSLSGADRPSILFYNDAAAKSWQIGQITSGWGTDDDFGIGYRASNDPNSFGGWPTNYFTITTSGNVGIGTTSPTEKLAVDGNIEIVQPQGKIGFDVGDAYGDYPHYGLGKSSGSNPVNLAGYYGVTFGTAGSERMRINSSGDLLVGTTTSTYNSANRGVVQVNGASTAIFALTVGGADTGYLYHTGTDMLLWNSKTGYTAIGTDGTERMRVTSAGNVGIGTTNPSYKLDVNGTGRFVGQITARANNGIYMYPATQNAGAYIAYAVSSGAFYVGIDSATGNIFSNGADVRNIYSDTTAPIVISTNSTARLTVGGAGALRFHAYGSGTNTGTVAYNLAVDSSGNVIETAGGVVDGSGTANYVPKWSDSNTLGNSAIYDSSGNIGIGTTNPGAKLEVVGTFRATTKSFIIDHPTKPEKKLQYGVLEGPEHSVYVRGRLQGTTRIELPDYWHALVYEDSITVNLTAAGKAQDLWVEEVTDTYITIASNDVVNCFYTVFAERKDVDQLVTEFDKE